jgi:hypothetical protein
LQNIIQQGRFTCTEEPGENADRDHFWRRHKEKKKSDPAAAWIALINMLNYRFTPDRPSLG